MASKIAALQLNSGADIAQNLASCAASIALAKQAGCALILLPENFAWLGDEHHAHKAAEAPDTGAVQLFLSEQAKAHGIWIIAGGHKILQQTRAGQRMVNRALVYDDQGANVLNYDKVHLFDSVISADEAYLESKTITAGEAIKLIDTPVGRLGLSICYDLRFPYFFQALRERGAQVVVVPSAFTVNTGRAHWEVLLRARAIENQFYIIAAAQVGDHPGGRQTYGHSLCIDAWGRVLASKAAGTGIISCEIDLDEVQQIRKKMPIWSHRKPSIS